MEAELRLLRIIGTKIDLNSFYSISFRNKEISLQGHCTEKTLKRLKEVGYEPKLHECNWIQIEKGCIRIVLTLQQ